jgi:predicted DNA binding protein
MPKKIDKNKLTPKQEQIIRLKSQNPEATGTEIAKLAGADISYTIEVLKKYGLTNDNVDDYNEHKLKIWHGITARILSSLSQEDIQKASLQQKITAAGIAFDKASILDGSNPASKPLVIINKVTVEGNRDRSEIIDVQSVVNSTQEASIIQQKNKPLEMIEENS